MACVFGEMRTLKTSERWWWWSPKCTSDRFPGIAVRRAKCVVMPATTVGECQSHPLCRVQPITFHRSSAPVYPPSLNDPCTRCLSQPTTSHTVSLWHYLALRALTLSRSIAFSHWVTFAFAPADTWFLPLSTSHTVSLYSAYIWSCVARQDNFILSHAQFDALLSAQVAPTVAAPTVAAHTLFCQPLLHYWCTIQHTAHHTNHCYTSTAPCSTPLGAPTSAAPIATKPTAAAPTTAALAMLHHTLCVAPSKHKCSVAHFSSLPPNNTFACFPLLFADSDYCPCNFPLGPAIIVCLQ